MEGIGKAQMTKAKELTQEQEHNYGLISGNPYKLVIQAKLDEEDKKDYPGLDTSKTFSMCTSDLAVAEGKADLILLDKDSQDFALQYRHKEAIEKLREQCASEDELKALNERLGACTKWAYYVGLKPRNGNLSDQLKKAGIVEDSDDSLDKRPYLLIGTTESLARKGYEEIKIIVPIKKADELFGYEKDEPALKGLTESEIDDYIFFRDCVETKTIEGQAFCRLSTARIYGTKADPEKSDLTINLVCLGAKCRTAILNQAKVIAPDAETELAQSPDTSTSLTSIEPQSEYANLNQQQVCLLSFSQKRFQELFGPLESLVKRYENKTSPTILNNIPMNYN